MGDETTTKINHGPMALDDVLGKTRIGKKAHGMQRAIGRHMTSNTRRQGPKIPKMLGVRMIPGVIRKVGKMLQATSVTRVPIDGEIIAGGMARIPTRIGILGKVKTRIGTPGVAITVRETKVTTGKEPIGLLLSLARRSTMIGPHKIDVVNALRGILR